MPMNTDSMKTDSRFDGMPMGAMKTFAAAYNTASADGKDEESCFKIAWAAVGQSYEKNAEGTWTEKPAKMSADGETITRDAKLFECGEYADKHLTVTEADLDAIVAGHPADGVPVKVEHGDSAFDGSLGIVQSIYRKGKELLGRIAFPRTAWAFLDAAGAKKLSCGVKRDKTGIMEVSIVSNPRVADAQIFADTEAVVQFSADFPGVEVPPVEKVPDPVIPIPEPIKEVKTMSEETKPTITREDASRAMAYYLAQGDIVADEVDKAMLAKLTFSKNVEERITKLGEQVITGNLRDQKIMAEVEIERFMRAGKITPAAKPMALALLARKPLYDGYCDDSEIVEFTVGDKSEKLHYAELFERFLNTMSPVINFREIARNEAETVQVPAEAVDLFKKLGADPEKAAKEYASMR